MRISEAQNLGLFTHTCFDYSSFSCRRSDSVDSTAVRALGRNGCCDKSAPFRRRSIRLMIVRHLGIEECDVKVDRPIAFRADAITRNTDDLLIVLDTLFENGDDAWWDSFSRDRTRSIPFFVDWPDESLVDDFTRQALRPGRVLELGRGNGRNAIDVASRTCSIYAIDFSEAAIDWAKDRARAAKQRVRFVHGFILDSISDLLRTTSSMTPGVSITCRPIVARRTSTWYPSRSRLDEF